MPLSLPAIYASVGRVLPVRVETPESVAGQIRLGDVKISAALFAQIWTYRAGKYAHGRAKEAEAILNNKVVTSSAEKTAKLANVRDFG